MSQRKRSPEDYEEFVRVWMDAYETGKSTLWVFEQTHKRMHFVDRDDVTQAAGYIRRNGVALPKLKVKERGANNYSKLQAIVSERMKKIIKKEKEK